MTFVGILIALLVLGVLVFVHEFGHFLMAKLNKIAVDEFSIGFGPELIGFQKGETHYRIGWIPFGGYCKMRGEESKDRTDAGKNDSQAMYNRPPLARLLAVLGGPVFNYLFAVVIMILVLFSGYTEVFTPSTVSVIESTSDGQTTPAWTAGLRTGDTLTAINNKPVRSFEDVFKTIILHANDQITVSYRREHQTNTVKVTPKYNKQTGFGFIGITPYYLNEIGFVQTNTPAAKEGLKPGDIITKVNNQTVSNYHQIEGLILMKTNQAVSFTIIRSNETFVKNIVIGRFEGKGYLGIYPMSQSIEFTNKAPNIVAAVPMGFKEAGNFLFETLDGLYAMIRGKVDLQKNISGPIGIVKVTGEVATKTDFSTLLRFIALISVALGFFNLLPIPGLDGGHVVFNAIELFSRRRFPEKIRAYIEYAGLLFIISLTVFVLFNDIFNIWMGR